MRVMAIQGMLHSDGYKYVAMVMYVTMVMGINMLL